jgi:transcription elongation factor S-II|uniref:TFIIS-type domain-containing protein n=1 Tax=viral metagenome TaxID=1070528 RepID=A0A6C0DB19_9ZZZZ
MATLRQQICHTIEQRLSTLSSVEQEDLERGIFNAALKEADKKTIRKHWENPAFADIYKVIARRCIGNLDPNAYIGNKRLLERLKEKEFAPHAVAFMTVHELFPENWQTLADAQLKIETSALEGNHEEGSSLFKCRRCGKSRTRYFEMQTRSADEPMTVFIRCLNCGKEWRQ